MLFDVGDPTRNLALSACFFAILALTVAAVVPWRALGAARLSRLLRWLFLPALALAATYEWLMPARFDIRVDLLLLLPMYAVIAVTCLVRWLSSKGKA